MQSAAMNKTVRERLKLGEAVGVFQAKGSSD